MFRTKPKKIISIHTKLFVTMFKKLSIICIFFGLLSSQAQQTKVGKASTTSTAVFLGETPPLSTMNLEPGVSEAGPVNPFKHHNNNLVPGKGSQGPDPLLKNQKTAANTRQSNPPSLVFETGSRATSPSDPTGAIGSNHYVSARNSSFSIHDRNGNALIYQASLSNIWQFEATGDPIVVYDNYADRFVVMQFSGSPNGILVAVCKGSDPVNDGWYTYRFTTSRFPDFPKLSIWSDGYYVSINVNKPEDNVLVLERDKLLIGDPSAQMVGFNIGDNSLGPGAILPFHATGPELPPPGNAQLLILEDDSEFNVDEDHLLLYTVNVNWDNSAASTFELTSEFTADNGMLSDFDFSNTSIPQPGNNPILNPPSKLSQMVNYRRFCDHNSVVLNFNVNISDNSNIIRSGIRWYELRQAGDGKPWEVYQEGTYEAAEGKSAWAGSIGMDHAGNIGMGYSSMGTIANNATKDSFVSINYTGRLSEDPIGTMTFSEGTIGVSSAPNVVSRYGDYVQLTIDPVDDQTFWHTAEYFQNTGDNARTIVGVFDMAKSIQNDVAVIGIQEPKQYTNSEKITVSIKNYGSVSQSYFPISYSVNGSRPIYELFTRSISPGETVDFTFYRTADLSVGDNFRIQSSTCMEIDENFNNNCHFIHIDKKEAVDIGLVKLVSPASNQFLSDNMEVTVKIKNFGIETQSNVPVSYTFNNGDTVTETISKDLEPGESITFSFMQRVDITEPGTYPMVINIPLINDTDITNNTRSAEIIKQYCTPYAPCSSFNVITQFNLSNVSQFIDVFIDCEEVAYEDFTTVTEAIVLNRSETYTGSIVALPSGSAGSGEIALWIDFNDNYEFDQNELLLQNFKPSDGILDDFSITIPDNVPLGKHRLRVRFASTISSEDVNYADQPCAQLIFGDTQDYTVEIKDDNSLSRNFDTKAPEFTVFQLQENHFKIQLRSDFESNVTFQVHSASGQKLATYHFDKNKQGLYEHNLDMSYLASGIYFVTTGTESNKMVKKILVE